MLKEFGQMENLIIQLAWQLNLADEQIEEEILEAPRRQKKMEFIISNFWRFITGSFCVR